MATSWCRKMAVDFCTPVYDSHPFKHRFITAFLSGRGDKDPSKEWYQGELWFFDNYVVSSRQCNSHIKITVLNSIS
jgi:hypothetical protein